MVVVTQSLEGQAASQRATGARRLQAVMEVPLALQLKVQALQIPLPVSQAPETQLVLTQVMANLQILTAAPTLEIRQVRVAVSLLRPIQRVPTQAKGLERLDLPMDRQLVASLHLSQPQAKARHPLVNLPHPAQMTVTV
jgi:hypothetical protein